MKDNLFDINSLRLDDDYIIEHKSDNESVDNGFDMNRLSLDDEYVTEYKSDDNSRYQNDENRLKPNSDIKFDNLMTFIKDKSEHEQYSILKQVEKSNKDDIDFVSRVKDVSDKLESGYLDTIGSGLLQGGNRIVKGLKGLYNVAVPDFKEYDTREDDVNIQRNAPNIEEGFNAKSILNTTAQSLPALGLGMITGGAAYGAYGGGIATALGAGVPGALQYGEAKEDAYNDGVTNDFTAHISGLVQAGLESAGSLIPIARIFNKLPVSKSIGRRILQAMAEGTVGEGVEEYLQGLAKPLIENGNISSDDWKNAWESAKMGAASGLLLGGTLGSAQRFDPNIEIQREDFGPVNVNDIRINDIQNYNDIQQVPPSTDNISNEKLINQGTIYDEDIQKSNEQKDRIRNKIPQDNLDVTQVNDDTDVERISNRQNLYELFNDRYTDEELSDADTSDFNTLRGNFQKSLYDNGITSPISENITPLRRDGNKQLSFDFAEDEPGGVDVGEGVTLGTESYVGDGSDVEAMIHETVHTILNTNEDTKLLSNEEKEQIVLDSINHFFVKEDPYIKDKLGKFNDIIEDFTKGIVKQHKEKIPTTLSKDSGRSTHSGGYNPGFSPLVKLSQNIYRDSSKALSLIKKLIGMGKDRQVKNNISDENIQSQIDAMDIVGLETRINQLSKSEGRAEAAMNNSSYSDALAGLKDMGLSYHQIAEISLETSNMIFGEKFWAAWDLGQKKQGEGNYKMLNPRLKYKPDNVSRSDWDRAVVDLMLSFNFFSAEIGTKLRNNNLIGEYNGEIILPFLIGFEGGNINSTEDLINSIKKEKNNLPEGDILDPSVYIMNALISVEKAIGKNTFYTDFINSIETAKNVGVDVSNLIRRVASKPNSGNSITIYDRVIDKNGKPTSAIEEKIYWISEDVKESLEGMQVLNENKFIKSKEEFGTLMKPILWTSRMVRSLITSTGSFGIGNVIKDIQTSLFSSSGTTMGQYGSVDGSLQAKEIDKILNNSGITGNRSMVSDKQDYYKTQMELSKDIISKGNVIINKKDSAGFFSNLKKKWNDSIEYGEVIGRTREFKRNHQFAIEKLGYTGQKAIDYAVNKTQEILNFEAGGEIIRTLGSVIPFLTSNIQGSGQFWSPKKNAIKMIWGKYSGKGTTLSTVQQEEARQNVKNTVKGTILLGITTVTLDLLRRALGDDDEYSDDFLNKYWVLPFGIYIPKGFDESIISNLIRNLYDLTRGENSGSRTISSMGKSVGEAARGTIPGITTGYDTLMDVKGILLDGVKKDFRSGQSYSINNKWDSPVSIATKRGDAALRKVSGGWYNVVKNIVDTGEQVYGYDINKGLKDSIGVDIPILKGHRNDFPKEGLEQILRDIGDTFRLKSVNSRWSLKKYSDAKDIVSNEIIEDRFINNYKKSFNANIKAVNSAKNKYYEEKNAKNASTLLKRIKKLEKSGAKLVTKYHERKENNDRLVNKKRNSK